MLQIGVAADKLATNSKRNVSMSTTGGATPRSWTPTTPPTNCWPKAPRGGGGGGGGLEGGGSGRGAGEGGSRGSRGGGGVGHLRTVGYAAQV